LPLAGAFGRLGLTNAAAIGAKLRGCVDAVNQWIGCVFVRKPVGAPFEPNGLADVWVAQRNGTLVQPDDQHRPLILVQATELGDFVIREMAGGEAIASDRSRGERQRLPGM